VTFGFSTSSARVEFGAEEAPESTAAPSTQAENTTPQLNMLSERDFETMADVVAALQFLEREPCT